MGYSRLSIIYFSRSGTIAMLARHLAEGAELAGAEVRVRSVAGSSDVDGVGRVDEPSLADLEWADALAFGSPTRFGNLAAELKSFLDSTGPLALKGKLADKAVAGFTSAASAHGGQEATLLALYHTMCHWGAVIVPTGYTDPSLREIGGNPYGLSVTAGHDGSLTTAEVTAARFYGARLAGVGARLARPEPTPQTEPSQQPEPSQRPEPSQQPEPGQRPEPAGRPGAAEPARQPVGAGGAGGAG